MATNKKSKPTPSKGQAAMEYLMTYGWAILVVLAIMAVLVVLVRPQQVPTCQISGGTELQCSQGPYVVDRDTGNLSVKIQNIGGVRYLITKTVCGNNTFNYSPSLSISSGSGTAVYFNCAGEVDPSAVVERDMFQKSVTFTYHPVDSPTFTTSRTIEIVSPYKS